MKLKQSIYLIMCGVLAACGSSGDKAKNSEEFKEVEDGLEKQIEEVVYNIPSPSELPYLIQQTGAEFNESLLNPRSAADKYISRNDKAALNLGVYASDIGYLSSYDKTQEAIDYLAVAKKLADNLNVIGSFDVDILKRFEANISNKDSLAHILNSAVQHTDNYLKNDSRNKLAALVVTGSFVEGLYISTGLVKTYPKNLLKDDDRNLVLTPLIRVILEQKKSVAELTSMLSTIEKTEPVEAILTDLNKLNEVYNGLDIEEQIKNNRADLVLTDKNLVEITNIIEKLRSDITK